MIDQDLIISRALVEIFNDDFLASELAFSGGTALHKLYLNPRLRSLENIDLIQLYPDPVEPIIERLEEVLNFFPSHVTILEEHHNTLFFHIDSNTPPIVPFHVKVDVCNFDHYNELGTVKMPYAIKNNWFSGRCFLTTYHLSEILGLKLCSLYQQKKGRDLFDLYEALIKTQVASDETLHCFKRNLELSASPIPTRKEFIENLEEKLADPEFTNDIQHLVKPTEAFTLQLGYDVVRKELIDRFP